MLFRTRVATFAAVGIALVAALALSGVRPVRSAIGSVLANGWRVTPAGSLTQLGTLPLHMAEDPSGRWLAVTNSGYGDQRLTIVDERSGAISDSAALKEEFYGLAWSPDGKLLYVAEAADGIGAFAFADGKLTPCPASACGIAKWKPPSKKPWLAGLAISQDGRTLFAVDGGANALYALNASSGALRWSATVGAQPYAVVLSADGRLAYVSNWVGGSVSVVDTSSGAIHATIPVCAHPNAELAQPDGRAVYVACANGNEIADIQTIDDTTRPHIQVGLYDNAPEGTTPNGLSLSKDGATLFVADADENAITAVSVAVDLPPVRGFGIMRPRPGVYGAVPAGWYATDVLVSKDGSQLFVLDGKGVSSHANPLHSDLDVVSRSQCCSANDQYFVGNLTTGDLERMPYPSMQQLSDGLDQARANSPYRPENQLGRPRSTSTIGGKMPPVKHVIYVIKENRTYDEVLGDDSRGNGDPALAIFGRKVTPNIHRLADDFVLLDNYDCDSEVSADGHNWATAAYATDYVQKLWPSNYTDRDRDYDFEEQGPASPSGGYLWDDAARNRVSFRDYGEFVEFNVFPSRAAAPGLDGHVAPSYPGFDLTISDQSRVDAWLSEFRSYVAHGNLPALEIVRLPNDHTAATRPGRHTPYAMVADNDYALARMVDAVSHSRFWKDTTFFVTEDDAQDGPDHVSDQRAEALVVGAWVKRGYVDHTHYTMAGMLRTMEWLLGLAPMSQFDASGTPMLGVLASKPDVRPWRAQPPNIDLNATNPAVTGANASMKLDLSRADAVDPREFNAMLFEFARTHPLGRNN